MKPYGLFSDIHAHNWSLFSTTTERGTNSRLEIILNELLRGAQEVRDAGGSHIYIAGDLLHTRGSMDPEVFNPLHSAIKDIADDLIVRIIPGNHDLKGRDTTELGNAIQTLSEIPNVEVVTNKVGRLFTDDMVMMVPWQANKAELRAVMSDICRAHPDGERAQMDLIIHVGIDGVLIGVPDSGLSAVEVASWGFRRVFAGDYHAHKILEAGKVISIGATTHQQWGDISTKAGFLLVTDTKIEYRASHAPNFIELTEDHDPDDYPILVDGNYVRIRGMKLTEAEINALRAELIGMGARGVMFQVTKEIVAARSGSSLAKASTLDQSVDAFVDGMTVEDPAFVPLIKAGAADVLTTIRSVAA